MAQWISPRCTALAAAAEKCRRGTRGDLDRRAPDAQWGPLGNATAELDALVGDTATRLVHGARRDARRWPTCSATAGPKRVFIALLNNAEMRDQGMVL